MTTVAAPMDPRMRARRIAVLRSEGRRRLRILAGVFCLAAAAAGAWAVSRTSAMDVDRVVVAGVGADLRGEVQRSSGLATGMPMLFLDIEEARQAVASLPWVRAAEVRRDWPATVLIEVEPRTAVAAVPAARGRLALIDGTGHAMGWIRPGERRDPADGLIHIAEPFYGDLGDVHARAHGALAVAQPIPSDLRDWIVAVALDDASGIRLELYGGATAVLGEPVLVDDKISAVRAVLAGAELECVQVIDVIMPDTATVSRHHGCLTST